MKKSQALTFNWAQIYICVYFNTHRYVRYMENAASVGALSACACVFRRTYIVVALAATYTTMFHPIQQL